MSAGSGWIVLKDHIGQRADLRGKRVDGVEMSEVSERGRVSSVDQRILKLG